MNISQYISALNARFKTGISREHSYRGDLSTLIETLCPDVVVTNEPARVACGAPDYIVTRNGAPVGYIEAKDIGADLGSKQYKEQFDRYKHSLNNLIITDYLTFQLFRDGILVANISVGQALDGKIKSVPGNHPVLDKIISEFCSYGGQTIKSASRLSKMMAGKARLLAEVIEKALAADSDENVVYDSENSSLQAQYESFKRILIHDITEKGFADIYAQTIAYGMFAARLHDTSPDTFSRQEAANLIPKSNPFLRKLFQYIAGYDLDDRIKWIVDALADIFRATNVQEVLQDFGKATRQEDPVIHFYETFLTEYDPKLRKSRGVWYTPQPVVNFIVRAVDDILKEDFGLPQGLADTSKTKITVDQQGKKVEQEVHKVQILDPATGTGTFLAEVVKHIHKKFLGQQGLWSNYVEDHLIPRLNGFEILMASYAMAHLKLDMLLQETGYEPRSPKRFRVFLTNSLEEHHADTGTLFASWLSAEAAAADRVKRDAPVMVVLGNPPYSVSSTNKGKWIEGLTADYKKDLNERNIQPLSDDYIKFIRYGQHFIEKNGSGILAFITNNSFIDGIIHRQMRKQLLKAFDKIYVLDLHGNLNRREKTYDGKKDENVFDIQQGVSINIFVKKSTNKDNRQKKVFHYDSLGSRHMKYDYLANASIRSVKWEEPLCEKPHYYFVKKDFSSADQYFEGFSMGELFKLKITGIKTHDDKGLVSFKPFPENNYKYDYRPFDCRYLNYDLKKVVRHRYPVMKHMLCDNISIIVSRQAVTDNWSHVQVSQNLSDNRLHYSNKGIPVVCPVYRYPEECIKLNKDTKITSNLRSHNLNHEIVQTIANVLGLTFTNENETTDGTFAPIDILDYIYAVLHSPAYREKYKEFLKIDFPRVPYPENSEKFWQLVKLGSELRQIHLLESPTVEQRITTYPQTGSNLVEKLRFEIADDADTGRVWINGEQYFDGVPKLAWEFYIGGYQPAQKWLKDRKGRELSFEDILHYQKIVVALVETDGLMKKVDEVGVE